MLPCRPWIIQCPSKHCRCLAEGVHNKDAIHYKRHLFLTAKPSLAGQPEKQAGKIWTPFEVIAPGMAASNRALSVDVMFHSLFNVVVPGA
jgi:hypothetical protein